jgi:hypothetical protein
LPAEFLEQGIAALACSDLVYGPSLDGGYYLVGLRRFIPGVFENIDWSTERVMAQSLRQVARSGVSVSLLPDWYDIDTINDLQRLNHELSALPTDRLIVTRSFLSSHPDLFSTANLDGSL